MEGILEKIKQLGDPLPSNGIQRTNDCQTHKGYDTDGYGVQFCVNRFNEVFGTEWGVVWDILNQEKGSTSKGKPCWEITVKIGIWVLQKENIRWHAGGHISKTHFDALKGAVTNGFKKAAALWGVGRHAYEGALDDDNDPWPEWAAQNGNGGVATQDTNTQQAPAASAPAASAPAASAPAASAPSGNGKESGLRKRIVVRLKALLNNDETKINEWFQSKSKTVKCLTDLDNLGIETLVKIFEEVEKLIEERKSCSAKN